MESDLAETAEDIVRRWLPALLEGLDQITDEEQRIEILEFCGRSCAEHDFEEIARIKDEARDREHLLQLINERIPWCGDWVWEEGKVRTVCAACGCPLVVEGYVNRSPTFCLCSRGWVKAVFGEALGEEVDVELVQAIGRGDECCEFLVVPRSGRVQGPSVGVARAGSTSRQGPETDRQRAEDAREPGAAFAVPAIDDTSQPDTQLTIAHLERAARWYRQNTRFNYSYMRLLNRDDFLSRLRATPAELAAQDVRTILITGFLNPFRCRVPRKLETAGAIIQSLVSVAGATRALAHQNLLDSDLSYDETGMGGHIAQTYDVIRRVKRVGPTTASKILHVLNPALCVMWDRGIRHHYSGVLGRELGTGADYVVFLTHMQELAKRVSRDFSLQHPDAVSLEWYLSKRLGLKRPVTLAKFLDEYNWVTMVRRVQIT